MATVRQVAANRENGKRSTGPRTEEGKARSRANALRHGLAGAGVVRPEGEAEAVAERVEDWGPELEPRGEYQGWLLELAARESIRMDRCFAHEASLRIAEADRAATRWEADRNLDAEELGATLSRRPATTLRKLEGTRQGAAWLRGRWEALGRILEAKGSWDDAQRALALDLLGTPPELRSGPTPVDGDLDALRALVARRVEELGAWETDLEGLDALARASAEEGLPAAPSKAMALLLRYERACSRRLHWALTQLRKGRTAPAVAPRSFLPDDLEDRDDLPSAGPASLVGASVEPPAPPPPPEERGRRSELLAPPVPSPALPRPVSLAGAVRDAFLGAPNRHDRRARAAMAR